MTTDYDTAKTTLAQLGGRMFQAMTGAKMLTVSNDGHTLSFRIGQNCKHVNHVAVTLNAMDTYDMVFSRIRGTKVTVLETDEGVYCEDLQRIFKSATGMETFLGRIERSV